MKLNEVQKVQVVTNHGITLLRHIYTTYKEMNNLFKWKGYRWLSRTKFPFSFPVLDQIVVDTPSIFK